MKTYIKVGTREYEAQVRLRRVDPNYDGRMTAAVTMAATVEEARTRLGTPGAWSVVEKDDNGNVVKSEDLTVYEKLMSVRDDLDGNVCAVLGAYRAEELLDILMGGVGDG